MEKIPETTNEMKEAVDQIFKILDDKGINAVMILSRGKEGGMLGTDDEHKEVYNTVRTALENTDNPLKDGIIEAVIDHLRYKGEAYIAPRSKVMDMLNNIARVPANQKELFKLNENQDEIH
jgi:uncharacterized protein (UPF0297 family)